MTTRLIVWRHGQTAWNAESRVQGQSDVDLSEVGVAQAAAAALVLAAFTPDVIVASDLRRAAVTADALAKITGLPVHLDPRLRERHFGQWQGLRMVEVRERWPVEQARWRAGEASPGCGVEPLDELTKRAGDGLREAADRAPSGTIVVATHGGTARHGSGALLGWPPEVTSTLYGLDNCHWTELGFDEVRGWQLRTHNVPFAAEPTAAV